MSKSGQRPSRADAGGQRVPDEPKQQKGTSKSPAAPNGPTRKTLSLPKKT